MVALQSLLYDNFKRTGSHYWQNAVAPVIVASRGLARPSGNVVSFRREDGQHGWVAANATARRVRAALVTTNGEKPVAGKRHATITLARAEATASAGSVTTLGGAPAVPVLTPAAPTAPWTPAQIQAPATSFSTTAGAVAPASISLAAPNEPGVLAPSPAAAAETGSVPPAGKVAETVAPESVVALAASPPAAAAASPAATSRKEIEAWGADWRADATTTPCGSCTGRACAYCSIRIGKPPAGTLPSGYSPRILQYHDQEGLAANTVAKGAAAPLEAPAAGGSALLAAANNAIVLENQKPGSPESEWMIDAGDPTIEGYAAQFSLNHGQRVDFKINTDSRNYRIDIYRLGYYGGMGAHKVTTINKTLTTAQAQPVPLFDPATKLVDAGNWSVSASWDVPADAVSGIYYAKLTRLDGSRGENMIPFIVRDDENPSDITFQTSDTTWQAYNWWGGYNFYGGKDEGGRAGRAYKVSYNRPIITRDGGFAAGPQDFIFGAEYPAIRWLEQNGYDVNYITGIDTHRQGAQLLNSKVFLSVGHDEYWSQTQRDNVEAARDAGVNLAFLSGNEVYWETRWETSIDGTGTPFKTLVSYKERWDNANTDPQGTTSTWRDPQFGSGEPENALTGTIFTVDSYRLDTIKIPFDLSNFRFWTNTAVANINPGQVYSLTPNLLGYEWDSDLDNGFRPAGLVPLSQTTVNVDSKLLDYGNTVGAGTADHSLTLYRAPSGALVFGAGTVYWVWGLDDNHDNEATPTDPNVQQAMVNLFADMGVQPATLMASLQAAAQTTDHTAPVSVITNPSGSGGNFTVATPITITGTATDSGGGRVAVVEVSTDGGVKWHRAAGTGTSNFTYTFTPITAGNYTIKTRAVDDSINLETPGAGRTITVAPGPVTSFFPSFSQPEVTSDSDGEFVNLGMRFSSTQSGTIVGMKFYKGIGDGGEHVGSLWTGTGTLLAQATFTGETASGWQTVTFSNPVQIAAGTTYAVSYFSKGHYASTAGYFTAPRTVGSLTAPANNGFFDYAGHTVFPTSGSGGTNYWVDVIFSAVNTPNEVPVAVNDDDRIVFMNTPITFSVASLLANDTDPNGDPLTLTGVGSATGGTVSFNSAAQTVTFTPTAGFTGSARFGYAIDDGRGGIASAFVNINVVEPAVGVSLFGPNETPSQPQSTDAAQVNLGMRFVASAAGTITGIKYYKSPGDTGTHTGRLWTSTGTLLATATFTNETASGWQTATFANPVAISAGTTYVASYHSNGRYALTPGYFSSTKTNGPLSAGTANGVYTYGTSHTFPTSTFGNTNYWVDVLFQQGGGANQPPTANNDPNLSGFRNTTAQISASVLLANDTDPNGDPLTITGVSSPTNGTVSFNAQTNVVSFTPTTGFTGTASFNYAISDGRSGTSSATATLNITATPAGVGFFSTTQAPVNVTANDPNPVELGMKFRVAQGGTITGVRFYKGPQNTGTHTGSLWSSTGTNLGNVTFTNESASGWQIASFANPVAVTAGTTYVVSYHSNGNYSADTGYFTSNISNGPITALASSGNGGNGVYRYGASAFPTSSFNASNYWVDAIFQPAASGPPTAVNDSGFTTQQNTPLHLAAASLLNNDTDPNGDTLSITGVSAPTNGTVSFDAQSNSITFTPNAGYTGAAQFTYSITDGNGGNSSANVSLNVTQPPSGVSLFPNTSTPATVTVNDSGDVSLGMKFTASANGTVSGVKFYKGPQNVGPHTGSLWTSTGTNLGNVTFSNETASGWQTATFATPINITAGQTYVVSYHSQGFYSANSGYFNTTRTNGPLTAPSSASSGGNGLYSYGSSPAFPTNSFNASNYWVDVIFNQLAG